MSLLLVSVTIRLAELQKLGENHRLKCEGWQRERTGLVPEMLFLATALSI